MRSRNIQPLLLRNMLIVKLSEQIRAVTWATRRSTTAILSIRGWELAALIHPQVYIIMRVVHLEFWIWKQIIEGSQLCQNLLQLSNQRFLFFFYSCHRGFVVPGVFQDFPQGLVELIAAPAHVVDRCLQLPIHVAFPLLLDFPVLLDQLLAPFRTHFQLCPSTQPSFNILHSQTVIQFEAPLGKSKYLIDCMRLPTLLLVCLTITVTQAVLSQKFQAAKDPWFELQRFEGTWKEKEVQAPLGPCNPCQYMIQIYSDKVLISVYNWGAPENVYTYNVPLNAEPKMVLLERSLEVSNAQLSYKYRFKPVDGYHYSNQIAIFDIGLYIKHSETLNRYLLLGLSALHTALTIFLVSLEKTALKKYVDSVYERNSFMIVILYGQLGTFVMVYQLLLMTNYMLHFEHFLGKIAAYSVFGTGMLIQLIYTGYMYSVVQRKLEHFFPQEETLARDMKKRVYKLAITIFIFLVCLMLFPLFLAIFHKQIWFSYFCLFGMIIQYVIAVRSRVYPDPSFMKCYLLQICYVTLLNNYYPILNFHENSRTKLLLFFSSALIWFISGNFLMKMKIREVRLEQTNSYGGRENSLPSREFQMKTEDIMKSDAELDPRAI